MMSTSPLGTASRVPHAGLRSRIRARPGLALTYRIVVFVAGLLCIAGGLALSVLPGPLTIPPVLLGLWLWSTEFAWAQRLFRRAQIKGRQAWQHAKSHPVSSLTITLGGLAVAGIGVWALRHFDVVTRVKEALGM